MRKPIQILVFPYRKNKKLKCIQYCLFLREDLGVWQGIAGGVEDNETIEQSALREMFEDKSFGHLRFISDDSSASLIEKQIDVRPCTL